MENKRISNVARLVIEVFNISAFSVVWIIFYNEYAFDKYHIAGMIGAITLYGIVYNGLCQVYKAFRIASYQIGETLFSQLLSFGITDLIFYFECCLISKGYVDITPGVLVVLAQIVGSAIWAFYSKRYFLKHIIPKSTILIYGKQIDEQNLKEFKKKILQKYSHLFILQYVITEELSNEVIEKKIDQCHTVLLYEVTYQKRKDLGKYTMDQKKTIYITPRIEDIVLQGCIPKHLIDTPLLKYSYAYQRKTTRCWKRILDILFSLIVIIITSPVMLITAAAIKMEDGGPIFYKQSRCTKDAKVFQILKFRSMVVDAEKYGFIPCINNDSRITKVGRIIRTTRIDELPQIINILKGDMSFVGPRPERVEHVKKYTEELPEFSYRLCVKGGLTGYAQIYGKYNTSAYDKLRLDLMYIENQSLIMDLKIILMTIKIMFIPESTEGFTKADSKKIATSNQNVVSK